MILSGPKDWRGSMKDARILPHFLHSACGTVISAVISLIAFDGEIFTSHRRRQRIMDSHVCVIVLKSFMRMV